MLLPPNRIHYQGCSEAARGQIDQPLLAVCYKWCKETFPVTPFFFSWFLYSHVWFCCRCHLPCLIWLTFVIQSQLTVVEICELEFGTGIVRQIIFCSAVRRCHSFPWASSRIFRQAFGCPWTQWWELPNGSLCHASWFGYQESYTTNSIEQSGTWSAQSSFRQHHRVQRIGFHQGYQLRLIFRLVKSPRVEKASFHMWFQFTFTIKGFVLLGSRVCFWGTLGSGLLLWNDLIDSWIFASFFWFLSWFLGPQPTVDRLRYFDVFTNLRHWLQCSIIRIHSVHTIYISIGDQLLPK